MQSIGFVGLGAMGAPMAWNIHKAGHVLSVYNRSLQRASPFAEAGLTVHDSPAALAAGADAVVIMVTDPGALHAVLHGSEGLLAGLRPGALVINMSTVSPDAAAAAHEAVAAAGGRFVDAPVSGTVKPAQDGTLVVLAGGTRADVEAATPLLQCMGKTVIYCGEAAAGTRMKLVLNLMLGGMMAMLGEGLTLGQAMGLDAADIMTALGSGPMNAPLYQLKAPMMLEQRFAKQFPVDLMFKDLNLVLEAAGQLRVPLTATAGVRELFATARALGYGDADMAAVVQATRLAPADA